jgi:hypothetical protein
MPVLVIILVSRRDILDPSNGLRSRGIVATADERD